jgi:uncharacterized OB-fold protein
VTVLEPPITSVAEPFWAATRRGELVLQWCTSCERPIWYPREVCPACFGSTLEWRAASGAGVVHAVSVHHLPGPGRSADDVPYAVALIDLAEGVRVMSNIVNTAPDGVTVGDAVQVTWLPLSDGRNLPQFEPAA